SSHDCSNNPNAATQSPTVTSGARSALVVSISVTKGSVDGPCCSPADGSSPSHSSPALASGAVTALHRWHPTTCDGAAAADRRPPDRALTGGSRPPTLVRSAGRVAPSTGSDAK